MFLILLVMIVAALVVGGFYSWSRRQGLVPVPPAAVGEPGRGHVSLLTEAVAYLGAILILAGGVAAIGQRWTEISDWGRVGILAGAAVFFLVIGASLRGVRDAAVQRLVGVVWFLSVVGVAAATGVAAHGVYGASGQVTVLIVGVAVSVYSAALWLIRKRVLQHVALFDGLVVTVCGAIESIGAGYDAPVLAFGVTLWLFGLAWALLGWRGYLEPLWVAVPLGVLLALLAPSIAIGEHGWMYAIAVATAAGVMAASVWLRNTALLALGTVAMFGYVTSMVVRYFRDSLGVPAALAITGALILVLAAVSARLLRETKAPKPQQPAADRPDHYELPKAS